MQATKNRNWSAWWSLGSKQLIPTQCQQHHSIGIFDSSATALQWACIAALFVHDQLPTP